VIEATMEQARDLLREVYGYTDFRDTQEQVIGAALEGRDTLVVMPTGGGKSLCYQLPSIIRTGTGLVVSPLIALMQDQVGALRQLGVRAAFLNSTLGYDEQWRIIEAVRAGALDLLYLAPERLLQEESRAGRDFLARVCVLSFRTRARHVEACVTDLPEEVATVLLPSGTPY